MVYEWKCMHCETVTEISRPVAEYNVGPVEACEHCGLYEWTKLISKPNITNHSYVMGGRRSDSNFQDAKQAANLEVQKSRSTNQEERSAISKEIKRLRTSK